MNNTSYLCYFAQELTEFRYPEIHSICDMFSIPVDVQIERYCPQKPFLTVSLPNERCVKQILSRSVLMRYMLDLWACGCSLKDIVQQKETIAEKAKNLLNNENISFKIEIEAFNKKISMDDKKDWITGLESVITFPAKVKLKNPDYTLCLLLDFGTKDHKNKDCEYIYFGLLIGHSQRENIQKYSLKKRYFIGNTSMDPTLSLLMANQGKAKRGSFLYDPFVGTGSILICCAHFGAYTAGSDIDSTIIYGRGKSSRAGQDGWRARDEIIRTNYQNYDLLDRYVDVMVGDITQLPLRCEEIFDAIITDPPYGIREGGRKLTSRNDTSTNDLSEPQSDRYFPAKSKHELSDVILDLIEFAARYLVVEGRLVYWLPVYAPTYTTDLVPQHRCFRVIANSEQILTGKISRRLITMEKIVSYKTEGQPYSSSAQISDNWKSRHNEFRANYFKGDQERESSIT